MRELSTSEFDWDDESVMGIETTSLVDRHSAFDGAFRSQRDLRVEGELKGTVSCDGTLFVAEGASVAASIDAEHITVAGDVSGDVRCRGRLQILPSGRVRASVTTGSLVIQEGAVYEGQLDMAGIERPTPRPLRSRPSLGPVSLDANSSERPTGTGTTFIRRLGSPESPWESASEPGEDAGEVEENATQGPAS